MDKSIYAPEIQKSIDNIYNVLIGMKFTRLIVFADVINRYLKMKVREEYPWLRINALLFIIARGGKLTPTELAKIMLRPRNSITKLIDGLEKDKFIKRLSSKKDRRKIYILITGEGIDFLRRHIDGLKELEDDVGQCMEKEELSDLVALSRKMRLSLIEKLTGLKS